MAHLKQNCVFSDSVSDVLGLQDSGTRKYKLEYPTSEDSVRVIHGILHKAETEKLISCITQLGLEPPPMFDKSVRNCSRRHTVDPGMSELLMPRIRPFLPEIVIMDGVRWQLSRFTHHWRYVKYPMGGKFVPHWDGAKMLPWHEMTVFTIQIYLNDDFEGGSTRFYTDYQAVRYLSHDIEYGKNQLAFDESMKPTHSVPAKTGSCLIFNHSGKSVLHDGEVVQSGEKYIMRGDILYSAIKEDIPLLKSPSCVDWCTNTASRRGTRNFIGQVWVCWCSVDDVGANIDRKTKHSCSDVLPPEDDSSTNSIEYPKPEQVVAVIKAKKPILVLLSGKRASGKDYVGNLLCKELESQNLSVCRSALGNINKRIFAEEMELDYHRLLTDRKYKEQFRVQMVESHAKRNADNPDWCIDEVMKQCLQESADILVLSDIRMKEDILTFSKHSTVAPIVLRVETNNETRSKRGWEPDPAKDSLPTETDMDSYEHWDAVIDNSNSTEQGETQLREWIRNTVLPRIFAAAS